MRVLFLFLTVAHLSTGCSVLTDGSSRSAKEFPQGQVRSDAASPLIREVPSAPLIRPSSDPASSNQYRIGTDDELEISVYGDKDLGKTQIVRPDGKISFPLIGDIQASGLMPDELKNHITKELSKYVKKPDVTVIIAKFGSKQVHVLGEVKKPGALRLSSDINLMDAISRVEGLNESADLQGALLVREGSIVPVNFEGLFKGDFSQNVPLKHKDVILIPNISAKKVFVLGEVAKPLVVTLRPGVSLIEAISLAGGFTRDAESRNVFIVRGGLGDPRLLTVNAKAITREGIAPNVLLQSGDIVYVPRSLVGDIVKFAQDLTSILTPVVLIESGIVLSPQVRSVLRTGRTEQGSSTSVVVPTR
jgi:polysaccharide export outer membrane protein